jgi:hypothetical protein
MRNRNRGVGLGDVLLDGWTVTEGGEMKTTIEMLRDGLCLVALVPAVFVLGAMVDLVSIRLNSDLAKRVTK